MIPGRLVEGFLICLPVVILLVVGAAIALHSGVDEVETSRDYRQIAGISRRWSSAWPATWPSCSPCSTWSACGRAWAGRDAAVIPVPAHSGTGIANPR